MWATLRSLVVIATAYGTIAVITAVGPHCRLSFVEDAWTWGGTFGSAISVATITQLRRRHWPRTVAMGFLAAVASFLLFITLIIPNAFGTTQRSRERRAMAELRALGDLIESGRDVPPMIDPWGHPYVVERSAAGYFVVTWAECSEPDLPPGATYPAELTTDPAADIVFSNGQLLRYPRPGPHGRS